MTQKIKAVALYSGGLDSLLAIRMMLEQGIEVHAVYFEVLFSHRYCPDKKKNEELLKDGKRAGYKIYLKDIVDDYIKDVLLNPKWGYGKGINPCVDCHAYMFRKAGEFMEEIGAQFIFTGEVMGERPMSQRKDRLYLIAKESGYRDYILRPLSAKLLKETIPEQKGWVKRELLEGISGRSRKRQMELAQKYGLTEFPSPAGGCAYTERNFGKRIRDFIDYTGVDAKKICLGKIGRHFRGESFKLILGRNHRENLTLDRLGKDEWRAFPKGFTAPTALIFPFKDFQLEEIDKDSNIFQKVANLIVRYGNKVAEGDVVFYRPDSQDPFLKMKGKRKEFEEMGLIQL